MASLLIHRGRGPVAKPRTKAEQKELKDWDLVLYEIWLQKIAANPRLYDDAKILHDEEKVNKRK